MNIKDIRALAKILDEIGLTSIEVSEGEERICLKRETPAVPVAPAAGPAFVIPNLSGSGYFGNCGGFGGDCCGSPEAEKESESFNFKNAGEIVSPLVGVFFASASPEAKPYVEIGSKVKKGDVLCIIEAMKLMNEITADRDGEIVDVLARSGQIVEYGQPLFKLI